MNTPHDNIQFYPSRTTTADKINHTINDHSYTSC